ncbi:aarF domain-containing kinase [Marchantia polymorpha subsp. ruderalis]|uniref:Protein kinase domain-containing protein n=2 Tax=Marchantia polymorpha TaxID=3197 RepID=A0A176VXN9_MARPO|nr:hypothetical protein AXG93_3444s1130 [Marchantia polymorpha subsp. ruderalis]PTQ45991.1 hypothetical protein MARPO_0013s0185 [Marchantia polymorpha]BBN18853.1 hypothetical protein Mp_8g06050 [Marchantia polymorpha subsp. ruderalis]|eukprot:PTQ45991.1 hypothetical protein MARPO_0013s0185 [Marchantia polymorpha]
MELRAVHQMVSKPGNAEIGILRPSNCISTFSECRGTLAFVSSSNCEIASSKCRVTSSNSALGSTRDFCSFGGVRLGKLYTFKSRNTGRLEFSRRVSTSASNSLQVEDFASVVEDVQKSLAELPSQTVHTLQLASTKVANSPAVEQLGQSASKITSVAAHLASELGSQLHNLTGGAKIETSELAIAAEKIGVQFGTAASTYYNGLGVSASPENAIAVAVALVTAVSLVSSTSNKRAFIEGEDIPLRYDPRSIATFFKKRPADVLVRSVQIMTQCSSLSISIILDLTLNRYSENEKLRARQLVDLIARLGPTAIKIGQALSIRPDLLSAVYLEELQKLQDRVPPFPNDDARKLISQGLGRPTEEVFSEMSEAPIAAASLGQVYKARLRETGKMVAVKVQRPGVLEGISMDLLLLRAGAYAFQNFPGVQSDLVGLLDTWAVRFYDELDYVQEAKNQTQFAENMRSLSNVTVPGVYTEYTTRKVLTTEWVEGEKLSESKSDDLLPLVSTALNCYLMQLLETGFLHADPHPGNLLRTPDGRLCVLDFGLMTQVTEDQRYSLIEYISHLVNSDYARVAEDLVRLGFVPPDMEDPAKTAAVVPQLSKVLGQLVQGGGARKINIQEVTDDLVKMSKEYVFVLPPYFALILRAFSVLEGIGLEADPDYTIVDECYPYISKRLLTDDSPRARAALKYFLYGGKKQLDVGRVEEIVGGFQSFREVMAPAGPKQTQSSIDPSTKEALKLIFAPEGSYIQELLLTELARSVDALSREALAELWRLIGSTLRIPGLPVPASLSAPRSWPLPVPGLFFGMNSVATLSEEDQKSLDTVKRLWALTEPFRAQPSPSDILAFSQESWPIFLDLLPGVTTAAQRFATILIQRQALRFADDLDGTNSVEEWDKDAMASARNIQPLRLFSFMKRERF